MTTTTRALPARTSWMSSPATSSWTATTSSWTSSAAAARISTTRAAGGRCSTSSRTSRRCRSATTIRRWRTRSSGSACMQAALTKPANSDIYTGLYAEFVESVLAARDPADARRSPLLHRRRLARRRERPEDGVRLESPKEPRAGTCPSDEGNADPPLPTTPSTAAPATRSRSRTRPIRARPSTSPNSTGRACPARALRFPVTEQCPARKSRGLEEAVEREIRKACAERRDDVAALIIEPIQGEGGDNHFRPEFFRRLRALADELEFLLIFDEVQTGVGLTGSMWCWQQFGVEPDLFCFGKKTQVCGFAVEPPHRRRRQRLPGVLPDQLDLGREPRGHGPLRRGTSRSSTRRTWSRTRASSASTSLGRLREMAEEFPGVVSNVRGRGLFLALRPARQGDARPRARRVPRTTA